MRRLAVIIEFIIAAIDCQTVLVIGVPHFGSVPPAARSAFDFAGEDGYPAVAILSFPAPFNFFLQPVKHLRADDSFMVMLHIVLRDFSFVIPDFLSQKVHSEALLQQSIAFVLFIGQDAFDRLLSPS